MRYKQTILCLLICVGISFLLTGPAMAVNLTVLVDGWDITTPELVIEQGEPRLPSKDEAVSPDMPINKNGILYMPGRRLAQLLGADISYAGGNIKMLKAGKTLNIKVNSKTALLQEADNFTNLAMLKPSYVINGQSYLPMRFAAEALGCTVNYNPQSNTISIITGEPLTIDGKKLCYATSHNFFSMQKSLLAYYGYTNVANAYQMLQSKKVREIEPIYEPSHNLDWQFQFYESLPVYEIGTGQNPENYVLKYKLYTNMFYQFDNTGSQFVLYDESENKWYEFASDPRYFCEALNNRVWLDSYGP